MKLANGVNEFFFKRISHVRPSLYPKISVTRMRTRRARFHWMARIFKIMASVNIETAYEQTPF